MYWMLMVPQLLLLVCYGVQPSQCADVGCVGEKGEPVVVCVIVLPAPALISMFVYETGCSWCTRPSRKTGEWMMNNEECVHETASGEMM